MWLIVAFDVPMNDAEARRRYARFRQRLLRAGFWQLEWSIYWYPFGQLREAQAFLERLRPHIPPGGLVHGLYITDRQVSLSRTMLGPNESRPLMADGQDFHYDPHGQYDLF